MVQKSEFLEKLDNKQQIHLLKYHYDLSIVKTNCENEENSSFKLNIDFNDPDISVEDILNELGWKDTPTLSFGYPLNEYHNSGCNNFIWNRSCYKNLASRQLY